MGMEICNQPVRSTAVPPGEATSLDLVQVLAGTELIFFTVTSMGLFWICSGNSVNNSGMF